MKSIRRKRLNDLLNSPRFNGSRAAFLSSSGVSKGRLTQLLNPDEPFGDTAARNLCESLNLPDGWFDLAAQAAEAPQNSAPNQALAHVEQAQTATKDAASLEGVLAALSGHLEQLDAAKRTAAATLLSVLAQSPSDQAIIAALASLLQPQAFTQQNRQAA